MAGGSSAGTRSMERKGGWWIQLDVGDKVPNEGHQQTRWTELLLICKVYSKMKGSLFEMGISGITLGIDAWHPFFVAEI